VTAREIPTWEFACDRCGYVDSTDDRWERRRGLDFCPGCAIDLYRFLLNLPVDPMPAGERYRYTHLGGRSDYGEQLAAKGVGW